MIFLKLGGSLLTDKTGREALRPQVLQRVAAEIAAARQEQPQLNLILGHGSGSFGHVAAGQHGTRDGVHTPAQWHGFAAVSDAAARLNRQVCAALLAAGVPAVSLSPSASAVCKDGALVTLATRPVQLALKAGLVPLVYGDVAFDTVRGGTIISTEDVLSFLAGIFRPEWLLLAGNTDGVYDQQGQVIPHLTAENLPHYAAALGGSGGTDVTGGMVGKVQAMLDLAGRHPGLQMRIFSGLVPGNIQALLTRPESSPLGTRLSGE